MDVNRANQSLDQSSFSSQYSNQSVLDAPTETMPVKIIKFFLYALVFIVGFGGNSIVIWIMIKRKKARNFHNLLLCNLAAADIALLSINLPFRLIYQENNYVWPFGRFLCKVIPMFTYLFLTASSLTLVAISYERYRKITSWTVDSEPAGRWVKVLVAGLWLVSCIVTLPLNVYLDVVKRKNGHLVCTDIWPSAVLEGSYFFLLFVIQFLLPSVVMVITYIRVGLILRQTRYQLNAFGPMNIVDRHRKTIRVICTIVVVYIVLTLPYHITWQLSTLGIKNALAKKFSVLFLTATSASHPIIYGTLHQEFSLGFKSMLCYSKRVRSDFRKMTLRIWSNGMQKASVDISDKEILKEYSSSSVQLVQRVTVV